MLSILDLQSLSPVQCAVGVCGAALTLHLLSKTLRERQLPLPPGPKRMPVIGNVLDVPKPGDNEAHFYAKHKALYGPISSLSIFGQTIIIINDYKIALDLLDRRSSVYSDRPILTFAGEMVGFEKVTTMIRDPEIFKLHRRSLHNYIGTRSIMAQHESLEEVETRRFLLLLLEDPDNLLQHTRTLTGAVILKMSHGYSIDYKGNDRLIEIAEYCLATIFAQAFQAGKWVVDTIPTLKHVPAWMPGAGFKRTAQTWAKSVRLLYDKPYDFVTHELAAGRAIPSLSTKLLEAGIGEKYGENMVKEIAATLYGGGADTTVVGLQTFYLAMALYPDVYRRAQEEIDRVVGRDRLPSFADRPNLPYIEAIVKETLRWESVVPFGLPHVAVEDDVYMGYRIPKGSVLMPIQWQMTHDPETYPDPFVFKPERFLEVDGRKPELDPRLIAFGFGRRICPGKELAESSMFITIAMTVAAFEISKAKDEAGREIEVVHEFFPGVISAPKPFKCAIRPRSDHTIALIRSIEEEHPFSTTDSEILKSL